MASIRITSQILRLSLNHSHLVGRSPRLTTSWILPQAATSACSFHNNQFSRDYSQLLTRKSSQTNHLNIHVNSHLSLNKRNPAGSRAASDFTGVPLDVKWTALSDALEGKPEILGAILPWSDLNLIQKIFAPYTYFEMYFMDTLLGHLPWWSTIVIVTASIRILTAPLHIKQNIMAVKTANLMPETQKLRARLNDAMSSGNDYEAAIVRSKIQLLNQEHNLTLKDRLVPLLIQAPFFVTMFMLLKQLSEYPVKSMITGGDLWFTNLVVPDPYYILPAVTCLSMLYLFEAGMEGASSPLSKSTPVLRMTMRLLPAAIFLFMMNSPASILVFWTTNNFCSCIYAMMLKSQYIRTIFKIPERIVHDVSDLPLTQQTFSGQVKNAYNQTKVTRTSQEVRRLDEIAFKKAGVGPLKKTYLHPPNSSPKD